MLKSEIIKLKDILTKEDYKSLLSGFQSYPNYIFTILANTRRVFIKLSEEKQNINFNDLDNLFKDLEDLE